ncbi:MAG: glycosyltransferase family 4 protein [Candidatus Omnitrophica bacterium]|nr:glycosyltransferase family 4 protein [Candidatus Omnitrophota bacterium]
MRVGINCHSILSRQYTGIGRYTYNLLKSLSQMDTGNEYWLYARKSLFNFKKKIPQFNGQRFVRKVDYFKKGIDAVLKTVDVYHSPSFDYFCARTSFPVVVTVHDLIFKSYPGGHPRRTVDELQEQFDQAVRYSQKIICCSQNTIDDIHKYFQVDRDKITLVHQGVDPDVFYTLDGDEREQARQTVKNKGISGAYILSVGTIEPRKNIAGTLRAFQILKEKKYFSGKLVVAGMKGWLNEELDRILADLPVKEDVVFPGYLTDEELRHFYNLAEVFVFPSFYEGFGYPIVEAFSCQTPVVTSNVSSCPEIAQDGALTVDPHDVDAIAEAIARLLSDQDLIARKRQAGTAIAREMNVFNTAKNTLAVYQQVSQKK